MTKKLESTGYEIVFVPAGEFTMGSDIEERERPVRTGTVDAYWIGKVQLGELHQQRRR